MSGFSDELLATIRSSISFDCEHYFLETFEPQYPLHLLAPQKHRWGVLVDRL